MANAKHKNVKTPTGMVHTGKMGITWAGTAAFMPACRSGSTALRYGFPTDEAVTCARCLSRLAKDAEYAARKAARLASSSPLPPSPAAGGCSSCGHIDHDGLVCHHVSGEDEPTYCDCDRTGSDD